MLRFDLDGALDRQVIAREQAAGRPEPLRRGRGLRAGDRLAPSDCRRGGDCERGRSEQPALRQHIHAISPLTSGEAGLQGLERTKGRSARPECDLSRTTSCNESRGRENYRGERFTRSTTTATTREQLPGEAQPTERPVIRLFGPLAIEHGARTLGPRDLGGARPKQVLEILLAARGHRVPVDRLAELIWGDEPPQNIAGSLQTFVSMLRRHLTPDRERAPGARRHRARGLPLRHRPRRARPRLLRRAARALRPRADPARARARSSRRSTLVRGEVLEDEPYATWALDLRGSYQGRILGAHLDAADAALAEHDFGRRARPRRGGRGARQLQRARVPLPDARPLRASAARTRRSAAIAASACGWTKSSGSSRPPRRALSSRPSSVRRRSASLLPRPIAACAGRGRGPRCTPSRPHRRARRPSTQAIRARARWRLADPDRGRGRARQDAPARRAGGTARRRPRRPRELLRARAAPAVRAARDRAPRRPSTASSSTPARLPALAADPARAHPRCSEGGVRRASRCSRRSSRSSPSTRPLALLLDDVHWADARDACCARIPAPARQPGSPWRS